MLTLNQNTRNTTTNNIFTNFCNNTESSVLLQKYANIFFLITFFSNNLIQMIEKLSASHTS